MSVLVGALAGLIVCATPVVGQVPLEGPQAPNFDLEWRWVDFGPEDGIPPGSPLDLQEIDGTPWLWTEGGIAFYDGFRWTPAPLGDAIDPSTVRFFSEDLDGSVVLVADGRVYSGNVNSFEEVVIPPLPVPATIEEALRDAEGRYVLVATVGGVGHRYLARVSDGVTTLLSEPGDIAGRDGMWRTRAGRIWVNFRSGLHVLEGGAWVARESTEAVSQQITGVVESLEGSGLAFRADPIEERGVYPWRDGGRPVREVSEGSHTIVSGDISMDGGYALVVHDTGDLRQLVSGRWSKAPIGQARRVGVTLVRFGDDERGNIWLGSLDRIQLHRSTLNRWGHALNVCPPG